MNPLDLDFKYASSSYCDRDLLHVWLGFMLIEFCTAAAAEAFSQSWLTYAGHLLLKYFDVLASLRLWNKCFVVSLLTIDDLSSIAGVNNLLHTCVYGFSPIFLERWNVCLVQKVLMSFYVHIIFNIWNSVPYMTCLRLLTLKAVKSLFDLKTQTTGPKDYSPYVLFMFVVYKIIMDSKSSSWKSSKRHDVMYINDKRRVIYTGAQIKIKNIRCTVVIC